MRYVVYGVHVTASLVVVRSAFVPRPAPVVGLRMRYGTVYLDVVVGDTMRGVPSARHPLGAGSDVRLLLHGCTNCNSKL